MVRPQPIIIGLNAVIVAVTDDRPRILTVRPPGQFQPALPFGQLAPAADRTLELGLRRLVREQTGLELGYVEQLYTFGDRNRDPSERKGGARVVSVAYIALVREERPSGAQHAQWKDWYQFFPWEDWRGGSRPIAIDQAIAPALKRWVLGAPDRSTRAERRERSDIAFGLNGVTWDGERVLERYELLYEIRLAEQLGQSMALDHRRLLATALGRLRGKIKYRPVVFELLPSTFTLLQLQRLVEALSGVRLHKQNLRRLVEKGRLVEGTGRIESSTGGRPAERFRFRRDVLRERPAPGVGLPGLPKKRP